MEEIKGKKNYENQKKKWQGRRGREREAAWGREDRAALRLLHIKACLSSPLST